MKKRYKSLKIKLSCILVAIMVFGSAFFTLFRGVQVLKLTSQYSADLDAVDTVSETEEVDGISRTYDMINSVPNWSLNRRGFYGALISPEGETVVESGYFLIVEKRLHDGENTDRRIIPLEEDFLSKGTITYFGEDEYDYSTSEIDQLWLWNWTNIEITGTCDLNYIYPEKIRIYMDEMWSEGYVEYVLNENKCHLGTVTVEEWLDGYTYVTQQHASSYTTPEMVELEPGEFQTNFSSPTKNYLNRNFMDKWLDKEAKKISQELYKQTCVEAAEREEGYMFTGNGHEGLFTSYDYFSSAGNGYYDLQYVFVYHPILIAMEDFWMIYVILFIFTLISLIMISVLINKAYKQQLINETNRQELTRGIAHELKTPLAITKGYIENWQYLEENEKTETKETIINEIDQMNRLVTDFLELSRLEAKNKEMHWEDVDLYSLTLSVIQRLSPIIEERKLNVTVLPDECENAENFIVEADLEMIRTAIVNYVSNAVKYADKEIVIKLSEKNKTVVFDIENDGATMDKKKISRVWDDFYKDSEYNRSTIGSSGLGLAITKNIFILHNAKYGCDCDNGKTHFVFEINKKRSV